MTVSQNKPDDSYLHTNRLKLYAEIGALLAVPWIIFSTENVVDLLEDEQLDSLLAIDAPAAPSDPVLDAACARS